MKAGVQGSKMRAYLETWMFPKTEREMETQAGVGEKQAWGRTGHFSPERGHYVTLSVIPSNARRKCFRSWDALIHVSV